MKDLREVLMYACRESYERTDLQFTVYITEDGKPYVFSDVAGGNSEPMDAWKGKDKFVHRFCNQFWNPDDNTDIDDVIDWFIQCGNIDDQRNEYDDMYEYLSNIKSNHPDKWEEYKQEQIDYLISDYESYTIDEICMSLDATT